MLVTLSLTGTPLTLTDVEYYGDLDLPDDTVRPSMSVGVVSYPEDGSTADELMISGGAHDLEAQAVKPPAIIVVGEVVAVAHPERYGPPVDHG